MDARRRARRRALIAGVAMIALAMWAGPAAAQGPAADAERNRPAVLSADEIVFDQDNNAATARGNVEIVQGDRVVRADSITYDQARNTVVAVGNVTVVEPTGDVLFVERAELARDMRDGVVEALRVLFSDRSRLAAVSARRADGRITTFRDVVYSPCDICLDRPERAPLWQLRAGRTTRDEAMQRIYHRDVWVEALGVPFMYLPFLAHPDGTARRQTGFLMPDIRSSSQTGQLFTFPFFVVLGQSADATIYPMISTQEMPVLGGEYRQRFESGRMRISGSITDSRRRDDAGDLIAGRRQLRYHVRGEAQFDIDDEWRAGVDAARTSDRHYLARYGQLRRFEFDDRTALTSRAYAERFGDQSYLALNAYAFQDLRPNVTPVRRPDFDDGLTPFVAPLVQHNWWSEPGPYGSRFTADSEARSIWRRTGSRTQRVQIVGGWALPLTLPSGQLVRVDARVYGQLYHAENIENPAEPFRPGATGTRGRVLPQVGLTWSWPLIRRGTDVQVTVEPVVQVVASPRLSGQADFPNEDSRGLVFDDTTLLRLNRFAGQDRMETGQRVTYGARFDARHRSGVRVAGFLGQSHRINRDTDFAAGSGLDNRRSDVVGRISVVPVNGVFVGYQFQHDGATFAPRRSQVSLGVVTPAVQANVSIVHFGKNAFADPRLLPTDPDPRISQTQLNALVGINLSDHWRLQIRHIRNLGPTAPGQEVRGLLTSVSAIYEDDCFLIGIDIARRNSTNPNVPSDTLVLLRLGLRNLGDVGRGL